MEQPTGLTHVCRGLCGSRLRSQCRLPCPHRRRWLGNDIVGDLVLLPLATATVGSQRPPGGRHRPHASACVHNSATNAEAEPFPTADNGPMPVRRLATRSRESPVRLSVDQTASASLEAGADIDPVAVGSASTVKDGGPESWTTEPPPAARSNPALITHRCTGGTTQARTMAKVLVSTVGVKLSMRRPAGPIRL